ncbi:UNVERIFIED_CONTAM: hypothetical protein K2H54_054342 [Gekko kuhli]
MDLLEKDSPSVVKYRSQNYCQPHSTKGREAGRRETEGGLLAQSPRSLSSVVFLWAHQRAGVQLVKACWRHGSVSTMIALKGFLSEGRPSAPRDKQCSQRGESPSDGGGGEGQEPPAVLRNPAHLWNIPEDVCFLAP